MLAKGILFLCAASPTRSQMAEGLARDILGPDTFVLSAGPTRRIDPFAAEVMREVGIDLSSSSERTVGDFDPAELEVVITLAAEEEGEAPLSEGTDAPPLLVDRSSLGPVRKLYWPVPDPAQVESGTTEQILSRFRATRDRIRGMIELFASDELGRAEFRRVE